MNILLLVIAQYDETVMIWQFALALICVFLSLERQHVESVQTYHNIFPVHSQHNKLYYVAVIIPQAARGKNSLEYVYVCVRVCAIDTQCSI